MAGTGRQMNAPSQVVGRENQFRVRPNFLAGCATVVAILILPKVVAGSRILEQAVLLLAGVAILAGWFLLLKDRGPRTAWRALITRIKSVYLVASLPVFLFGLSPWKWFVRHPLHSWFSLYAKPWVHWGYAFVLGSVICSFLARGRARIALVTSSVLLMVLWEATGTWVF